MTNEPNQSKQTNPTHLSNQSSPPNQSNDAPDGNGDVVVRPMDESLDALLRQWHHENAARAAAQRDTLLRAVAASEKSRLRKQSSIETTEKSRLRQQSSIEPRRSPNRSPSSIAIDGASPRSSRPLRLPLASSRLSALAAILLLGGTIALFLAAEGRRSDARADVLLAAEGGKLDAVDARGQLIGPCPLKHTDVDISVSGLFSRVTVRQRYANPYPDKIEAVYTFPLSHRAAVDRMTMTLGDRVIVGEVKEREQAKAIYQAAKSAGHVAGLLEQERPNIFTQSVANIEPGVEIVVEISYVELLESRDGVLGFAFPMVVAPRYIPGNPLSESAAALPAHLRARHGLILYGPATATITAKGDTTVGEIDNERLTSILSTAEPIDPPEGTWWSDQQPHHPNGQPVIWQQFQAAYTGGGAEAGVLYTDGTGQLGGRWFYIDPKSAAAPPAAQGAGYAPNTTQVPDAARITPMPVKPPTRAGHDISITVHLDTGGPGITDLASESHEINQTYQAIRADGAPREISLSLKEAATIPNKDFVLHWKQTADTITEQVFTHAGPHGNFITLILNPPNRVQNDQVVPRELVFVLDTSGSMQGFPIEKAKEVMSKAIAALRPNDTFNLITFAGDTRILWDRPQPASTQRLAEAQTFLAGQSGNGGTEMMAAINAALEVKPPEGQAALPEVLSPRDLANLPADGRAVRVSLPARDMVLAWDHKIADLGKPVMGQSLHLKLDNDKSLYALPGQWTDFKPITDGDPAVSWVLGGTWQTLDGERTLVIDSLQRLSDLPARPIRIVCFMTDGEVGNDLAIIDAVKKNAGTTRVFSFGIGNSVNRYLLDSIALAGRGAAEYVLLNENADAKVAAFSQRIQSPVLIDPRLEFSPELQVIDRSPEVLPDLYDVAPVIVHARCAAGGKGTVTLRGQSGGGAFERTIEVDATQPNPDHDVIATLWARAKVDDLMNQDLAAAQNGNFPEPLRKQVVALGETFGIMTQFTSFVAVENLRVTLGGEPKLVPIPIELPDGQFWEGTMGEAMNKWADNLSVQVGALEEDNDPMDSFTAPEPPFPNFKAFGESSASAESNWQSAEANYRNAEAQIKKAVIDGDFARAHQLMAYAKQVIEQNKAQAAGRYEPFRDHAVQLERYIDDEQTSYDETEVISASAEFEKREVERVADMEKEKARQVSQLMQHATELRKERRYDDAATVLGQALSIDPNNEMAQAMRETLIDISPHVKEREATVRPQPQPAGVDVLTEAEETVIPWHKDILYPKNWAEIAAKRQGSAASVTPGTGGESAESHYEVYGRAKSTLGTDNRQPVLGDIPGIGKALASAAQSQSSAKGKQGGPETVYYFDTRSQQAGVTPPAPPPMQPAPSQVLRICPTMPAPGPAVDMWALSRANTTTPKQINTPAIRDLPAPEEPGPKDTLDEKLIGARLAHDRHSLPKGQVVLEGKTISVASADSTLILSANESDTKRLAEILRRLEADSPVRPVVTPSQVARPIAPDASAVDAAASSPRLLVDQLLLQIAALYQSDRAVDALALADSLLKLRPTHRAAQAMRDALASGVLNEPARARILAAHVARAARRLAALAETTKTLVKHLDERLLRLAMGDASADARQGLSITDAGVQAALLLTDVNDARLKSLKAAGVTIESVSKPTHVVIGRVPAEKLSQIALTDGLRRAEAVRAE